MSLIPIDTISENIVSGMGDSTGKYKFSISRHLLSGYRQLNLFVGQDFNVKTEVLEYDNVLNLPCDFIYETKVGVKYKGNIAVLSLDKSIGHQKMNDTSVEKYLNSIWDGVYSGGAYTFHNYNFRGSLGELYGYGRGVINSGCYNISKKDGCIYIGSLIPEGAEIVLEYKSDGISDGLKLVPSEMEMCLSYWAKARFYEERKDYKSAEWNENKYLEHYYQVKRLYNFKNALYLAAEINKSFSSTNY